MAEALGQLIDHQERTVPKHCSTHGDYDALEQYLIGQWRGGHCPKCSEERQAEQEERKRTEVLRKAEDELRTRFGNALIPLRFHDRTLDSYKAENIGQQRALKVARRYADNFGDRHAQGGGLVFCGKPGTGKSHLAAAIANHVIPLGATALWLTVMQAVRSVKETWSRDAEQSESQAIETMLRPDLLILDEVGVQFGSEAERIILFEIINGRYQAVLPTILISNLPESELGAYLGERVLDRMKEGGGAVVAFDWESYRR
jgi:DNA replication protein DnaC